MKNFQKVHLFCFVMSTSIVLHKFVRFTSLIYIYIYIYIYTLAQGELCGCEWGTHRVRICLPRRRSTVVCGGLSAGRQTQTFAVAWVRTCSGGSHDKWCQKALRWQRNDCTALFLPGIIEWLDTQGRVKVGPHDWLWVSCGKEAMSWLAVNWLCADPRQTRGH